LVNLLMEVSRDSILLGSSSTANSFFTRFFLELLVKEQQGLSAINNLLVKMIAESASGKTDVRTNGVVVPPESIQALSFELPSFVDTEAATGSFSDSCEQVAKKQKTCYEDGGKQIGQGQFSGEGHGLH